MINRIPIITMKGIRGVVSGGEARGDADKGRACGAALQGLGVDEAFVAAKLKVLLGAQKRQWNPEKKLWEKVDDHDIQLRALREVAKILGIYPSAEDMLNSKVPQTIDISAIPRNRERADSNPQEGSNE